MFITRNQLFILIVMHCVFSVTVIVFVKLTVSIVSILNCIMLIAGIDVSSSDYYSEWSCYVIDLQFTVNIVHLIVFVQF